MWSTPRAAGQTGFNHTRAPEAPVLLVLTAIDVTDARESAGMVTHVLRSLTSIAFIGTDLGGRITLFNAGAERMLGVGADQAAGRPIVDFLGWAADRADDGDPSPALEGRPTFADLTARSGSGVFPDTRDWTALPEGRAPLRVSVTGDPVSTSFGQVFAHLFVARDITETRRSQEILVKALRREREVVARLKDLDRAKDDFVSTVSHELRTPMSSIIGSAEMLADGVLGDLSPEQARMIDVIARNGDRLPALADDLLVLATFDRDTWPAQTVPVDLGDVVRGSAGAVAGLLEQRVWGSRPRTRRPSSVGSSAPRWSRSGPYRGPGSGCRSSRRSWRATTAGSASTRFPTRAAPSP
ncbi:MAG: tmoS [Frankiales bacterium]|nr:tmoS [Frankiales bacterium]